MIVCFYVTELTMTRGGRDPPKQLSRKVGTKSIRVQPYRPCKVTSQAAMPVMSTKPNGRTASGDQLDPLENSRSQVTRRRRASQRQAASKLSSRKTPPAASLAPSATKTTKSVASMSPKLDKNLSRVEIKDTDESLKSVGLAPQTRRATKRGQERAPKGTDASISGKRPPKPTIGTDNSPPPFATSSHRQLRSYRTSELHRSMSHQHTLQNVEDKTTKPPTLRELRKKSIPKRSIGVPSKSKFSTFSNSATTVVPPVSPIVDTLEPAPGPSTQQESGTTKSAAKMALPIPEGHKLVHFVRHCRAWHK